MPKIKPSDADLRPKKKLDTKKASAKAKPVTKKTAASTKPKKGASKAVVKSASGARLLQSPKRIWYKPLTWRHRRPTPVYKPLPKARRIFRASLSLLWKDKKLFGGIILIYGILNAALVQGLVGSNNLVDIKSILDTLNEGFKAKIGNAITSFVYLIGSSGSGNTDVSGVYQSIFLVVCSLAVIWALRQVIAKRKVRIRDSFYQGMYPLVPFLLVFLLLGLQLVPLIIGSGLYSQVISNGIAVHLWEKAIFAVIMVVLVVWSLRMITATIFALYIVTLPDMTPLRAYRSARELVFRRRLLIWRKLLFLPIVLFLLAALIELPLIMFVTPAAAWVFFVLSMAALGSVHAYLYSLYRELL